MKKNKHITIKEIAAGKWFTTKFFLRRIPEIIVLAILTFLYIDNGYYCIAQEMEIKQLKQDIQDAKSEALKVQAELTQTGMRSNIEKMVSERGLLIETSQKAKYVIEINDSINSLIFAH
jgi:hypothetical protein